MNSRREFLSLLLATLCCPIGQNGNAKTSEHERFYFAKLSSGIIYLPNTSPIDYGQPGSLMKLVAAAAIVEQHLPSAYRTIDCKGAIIMNGQKFTCRHVHGHLGLVQAIAQSCNVFFCHASKELSKDCFIHYLKNFGLTQSLPASLLENKNPKLKSIDFILGTAPEFELSAIQILQMTSLIANRGKLTPASFYGKSDRITPILDPHFSEHTWNMLQQGMQMACQRGTAKNLDPQNKLHIAAKTGTTVHGYTFQSWLAGYFPYEAPRYAFCLRAKVGTSYDQAIPLARQALFERSWL